MKYCFAPVLLFAALLASAAHAQDEEAVKVYKDVQACVVSLQNIEGTGTGMLLDRTGLILTNAHVVASPLPFTCKVDLRRGGKYQTVTFKKVKILGVHPKMDLALVRINPKEHNGALQAAVLSSKPASPGQRVYAIGNPVGSGMVLSKTITPGIVSGVDRVIDDVSYYQISAAVNPGNSGGPLCDRKGQVVGLVTLKFTDVENVGFAIPLRNLRMQDFIPLSKRKGDPEKAKKALELADKYYKRSEEAYKRGGGKDPDYLICSYLAARCYHLALMHDPGNSGIYYNVGMLLRTLDQNEVAVAYLLQAIQLDPWRDDVGNYYRELGFALMKQKKNQEAHIAWEEGLTKYPARGAKIWEDLGIWWINDGDHYKAAYCAAVVIKLNDRYTRIDNMKALYRDGRAKLTPQQQKKLEADVAKIEAMLRRRKLLSDQGRRAGKPYLTTAFAKYVQEAGTLGDDKSADVVAKIDRKPPRTGTKPPDDRPTKPVGLDLTIPKGSTDLLRNVSVKRDAVKGVWKFDGHALVSPPTLLARLEIPQRLPEEYDLTLIVERKSNRKELVVGFVRGGVQSAFYLDADGASGIDPDGRGAFRGDVLTNDRPATLVMKIRREGLLITVDGKRIFFQRTERAFPETPAEWAVNDASRLFLGSRAGKYYIHKLMLTPYRRGG